MTVVVFVGFNDVYNDITDCEVKHASDDFKTERQAMQFRVLSICCMIFGFISFVYYLALIFGQPKRHVDARIYLRVWIIIGELSTVLVTNLTLACVISYYGYPFTTLSDLYDLVSSSQTAIEFKKCGVPKRDDTYMWCLFVQLFLSLAASMMGFVGSGIYYMNKLLFKRRYIPSNAQIIDNTIQSVSYKMTPMEYISMAIFSALALSMSCVTLGGFSEARDDIDKCEVENGSVNYDTDNQGTQLLVISIFTFIVGVLSFIYRVSIVIFKQLGNETMKIIGGKKVMMCAGELSSILFTTMTMACLVTYLAYPFTTLSDLYDLAHSSQHTIVFKDCGVPKRDVVYLVCLLLQLLFTSAASTVGFARYTVRNMWLMKTRGATPNKIIENETEKSAL